MEGLPLEPFPATVLTGDKGGRSGAKRRSSDGGQPGADRNLAGVAARWLCSSRYGTSASAGEDTASNHPG